MNLHNLLGDMDFSHNIFWCNDDDSLTMSTMPPPEVQTVPDWHWNFVAVEYKKLGT